MRLSSRTWSLISVTLLLAGAFFLWLDRRQARLSAPAPGIEATTNATAPAQGVAKRESPFSLLSLAMPAAPASPMPAAAPTQPAADTFPDEEEPELASGFTRNRPDPLLLINTDRTVDELARRETAVLLENAFIDTAVGLEVDVPEHLRPSADPGGYLVQSTGALDRRFYDALSAAGAEFVAYVPNNTALVKASAEVAARLNARADVRAVLPYAPYYKISRELLSQAVDEEALDPGQVLKVVLYPGARDEALPALAAQGWEALGEARSPFGPTVAVRGAPQALVALAGLPSVQRIEATHPRVLLNDLARYRVAVTTNMATNTTYLSLSGKDILVNVNDSGVDENHPGLIGRVSTQDTNSFTLVDPSGHGTHVAGTLAGNGAKSEESTNVVGSLEDAIFSGMATQASVYVLPIDLATGPLISDLYLQEEAATEYFVRRGETNVLVSNNSWNYLGSRVYDLEAASYDAATRDALPDVPGMQPLLFVFSAGNSGRGSDDGLRGQAGSIGSPGTAKNVITVGALEQLRLLTNAYYVTNLVEGTTNVVVETNMPFYVMTDSDREVASYSSRGNVGIGREGDYGRFKPDVVAPGSFLVSARSAAWALENDWPTDAPEFPVIEALNDAAAPEYRFETGTSMAAPVVSGLLALMQEFYETKLQQGYSPALLKALLLHGTRPVSVDYNLEVGKILNHQGWGLPNLTNSLPLSMDELPEEEWPQRIFADPQTNVLATGESHTWILTLASNAQFVPFRATLVWTDPPGNPGAAIKLVNDLDLVVTNLATMQVYWGNYIVGDSDFTAPRETNSLPVPDFVNNVENVIMPGATTASTNEAYQVSVTVTARKVNVNAVTSNTNDVVQDYALIFTAGEGVVTNAVEQVEWTGVDFDLLSPRVLTNGVAQLQQRAGANFQLVPGTNGVQNQWAFYVFTNTFFTNQNLSGLTNGSNVAFITFLPPNLSRPRNVESDIDLYVSKNPALLTLDPGAIANADKSLLRGGTELLVYTNATTNDIFYIGVKAEDQQASEFGLIVLSTDEAFSDTDEFGNQRLFSRGLPVAIPDGSNEDPGGVLVFAFTEREPVDVVGVIAQPVFSHENVGDLVGILGHQDASVTLHNHNRFDGSTNTLWALTYEDNPSGNFPDSFYSDGPGSLKSFIGHSSQGVWMFSAVDEARNQVGSLESFTLRLTPNRLGPEGVIATVPPNEWVYFFTNVPPEAVSLTATIDQQSPQLPLDLYLRRGFIPDFDNYDKMARIPGDRPGSLTLSRFDSPPLNAGRMFIGVYNPNNVAVTFRLRVELTLDLNAVNRGGVDSQDTPLPIQDDAITRSTLFVPEARPVIDVQVGVRVDHDRASDLVFHLISPQGTRVLLAENRGGTSAGGYGATLWQTNVASASSSGGFEETRQVIDTGVREGLLRVHYDFRIEPDTMHVYYDGILIYDTGPTNGVRSFSVNFGPGNDTNLLIVVNEGRNPSPTTSWSYTAEVVTQRELYTVFTERTNLTTLPVKFASGPFTNSPGSAIGTNRSVYVDGFESYATGVYSAPVPLGFWNVSRGAVAVHGATNVLGVTPFEGTNFLELIPGSTPASLGVEVGTSRSARYGFSVAVRSNPSVPPGIPQALGLYANDVLVRWIHVTDSEWQEVVGLWQAEDTTSRFEIRTTSSGGPLIDAVTLVEVLEGGEAYFLAEEDIMRALEGESPFGTWTLEMRDDRAGVTAPQPELLSWTLNFIFANTNPPVTPLLPCRLGDTLFGVFDADCAEQTNYVVGDEIQYFSVQAPLAATRSTNLVLRLPDLSSGSGNLVLLYSATGLPTGNNPGDVRISTLNTNGEFLILRTNSVPPLEQGQRYYLGVANLNPNATNAFLITAEFDAVDGAVISAPFLTNSVPVTNVIAGATNVMHYYQFAVSASTTTHVTYELQSVDGNVDLFLRRARPLADPLPRPNPAQHDYASELTNATDWIVVTRDSIPEPLDDGIWYVGVLNRETNDVTYVLEAREWDDLLTLNDLVAEPVSIPSTNGLRYFRFDVSPYARSVQFTLETLSGDADMYVSRVYPGEMPLPDRNRHDYFASRAGNLKGVLIDALSPVPLQPGIWYLALENLETNTFDGLVLAVQELSIPPNVIPLTDGVPYPYTRLAGQTEPTYFLLSVTQDQPSALFEVFDMDQSAELLLGYGAPPTPGLVYRRSSGDPSLPPQIVLRTSSGDPLTLLGDWYAAVVPADPNQDFNFTIRAATAVNGILSSARPSQTRLALTGPNTIDVAWNAIDGEKYRISRSPDLVNWTVLATVTAVGRTAGYTDDTWSGVPPVYYRITQVP